MSNRPHYFGNHYLVNTHPMPYLLGHKKKEANSGKGIILKMKGIRGLPQ